MGRSLFALVISMACMTAACGSGGPVDCGLPMPGSPAVFLGTGTVNFEPLNAGQDFDIIAGPQGGFHFVIHAQAEGIIPGVPQEPGDACNPETRFTATRVSDGLRVDNTVPTRLGYREEDGRLSLPSGRFLTLDTDLAPTLYGEEIRIDVVLTDADGNSASSEITIMAVEGPEL